MTDAKQTVRQAYNSIADKYLNWVARSTAQEEKTKVILARLKEASEVLDLGCGAGVPAAKLLADRGHHVTGIDISEKQIELAKQNVPSGHFTVGDMASLELEDARFDAVLALFTIFHLPRVQHEDFLKKISSWLKPGGLLMVNFTATELNDQTFSFLGADNFFSGWDTAQSEQLVRNAGFIIVEMDVRAQGDVDDRDDPDNGVSFFWVLAQKPS